MQARRVAAARPASAGAAVNFAEQRGSPHAAALFMRCIAAARVLPATSVWQSDAATHSSSWHLAILLVSEYDKNSISSSKFRKSETL